MPRRRLFRALACLIILIFFLNFVGGKLYWYTSIWWFDMPMHFLGGLWLGTAILWIFYKENISLPLVFKIIAGVLLVGVAWEVFEILVNNTFTHDSFNTLDTVSDIFFDVSGGLCAILYLCKNKPK